MFFVPQHIIILIHLVTNKISTKLGVNKENIAQNCRSELKFTKNLPRLVNSFGMDCYNVHFVIS